MLKPLYDRIIIKQLETKQEKLGSLYIPDNAKDKSSEGEVIAVGEGVRFEDKLIPLKVNVGDVVIFDNYSATPITEDGEEYLIIREQSVLAIKE